MEYLNMKEPAFEADDLNGFLTGYHCDFAQVPYYNIIFSIQWIIQILTENFKKANGIYFVKMRYFPVILSWDKMVSY